MGKMQEPGRQFPKCWPPCCPPVEASPADGTVFAVAENNPFTAKEFTSAHSRNVYPNADPCRRHGVSVLSEIDDAFALLDRYKNKYKHIGVLSLTNLHGVLMKTPTKDLQSHHTLWAFEQVELHLEFSPVP